MDRGALPTTSMDRGALPTTSMDRGALPITSMDRGALPTTSMDRGALPITSMDRGALPTTSLLSFPAVVPERLEIKSEKEEPNTEAHLTTIKSEIDTFPVGGK
ncbi:hypothetical protein FKM82_017571 [Ascaphus truei]